MQTKQINNIKLFTLLHLSKAKIATDARLLLISTNAEMQTPVASLATQTNPGNPIQS